KKAGGGSATATPAATSIADLAKAAMEKKPGKPLAPQLSKGKIVVGWIQAIVMLLLAAGCVAGVFVLNDYQAKLATAKAEQEQNDEWEKEFKLPLDKVVADCKTVLADQATPGPDLERKLFNASLALETLRKKRLEKGNNYQRQEELDQK